MFEIQTKREVRFATVERSTAWIVLACVVEIRGDEVVPVSKPKIVRVILKNARALAGNVAVASPFLALPSAETARLVGSPLVSPFISSIFGYINTDIVVWYSARPPTA